MIWFGDLGRFFFAVFIKWYYLELLRLAEAVKLFKRRELMGAKFVLYEKPTCTKCRQANKLLKETGVDYERINYYETPISASKLKDLLKKMSLGPRDIMRTTEKVYRELGIAKGDFRDKELIDLMIEHPDLIQRPIVEKGGKAVLGRPTENINEILN